MSAMLEWRHLVPTAPDTLIAVPQTDDDPFIIEKAPDVLFAGNQAAYGTSLRTGTYACYPIHAMLCMLCMLRQLSSLGQAGCLLVAAATDRTHAVLLLRMLCM